MLLPAEFEARIAIPALGATMAKKLVKDYRLSEKEAALLLGLTQAAVSNYTRGVRGVIFFCEDKGLREHVVHISEALVEGTDYISIRRMFVQTLAYIRENRLTCGLHKQIEPSLRTYECPVLSLDPIGGTYVKRT
jgi:predicted transcriptional regulator